MLATTIKLDGVLTKRLARAKPRGETLTGFVRSILDADLRRRAQRMAADVYVEFLRSHPEEAAEMDAWSTAPLARPRKSRRRK